MFGVIGSILKKAGKGIGKMFFYTKEAFGNFHENPIPNLSIILSSLACLIGGIGFIISYILFLFQGGYDSQIVYIKDSGFMAALDFAQSGTGTLYWKFMKVASPLLGIGFILLIICYFRSSSLIKNILIILDLIFLIGAFLLSFVFYSGYIFTCFFVSLIICILLFHFSEERYIFQHCIKSTAILFAGVPAILWVLENIVVLTVGIVGIFLTMGIIFIIFKVLLEEISGSAPITSSGRSEKIFSDRKKSNISMNEPQIINYDSSRAKAYVKENAWGKQVYVDNEIGMTRHICSYKEYKEGKYIIKIQGREVRL